MQTIFPSFYPDFQCRAGQCAHSCCRGWEIDIDAETAEKYRTMTGPLAEELRSQFAEEEGTAHFILDPNGNCPMLREDGLCRLILERGEEDLCDICALHPRFFEQIGDRELWGLGLSCEEVCSLLLRAPLRFAGDGPDPAMTMAALLERLSVAAEPALLTFRPILATSYIRKLLSLFAGTEPIDRRWAEEMSQLLGNVSSLVPATQAYALRCDRERYQKLYEYVLYRQLEQLSACSFPQLAAYAEACTQYIFLREACAGEDPEVIRRFSEQIEYSEENTTLLLQNALSLRA